MKHFSTLFLAVAFVLSFTSCNKQISVGHPVDLGLPSGTLWADCNIGATAPEELGDYFSWGEIKPKRSYLWDTYSYGKTYNSLTKYCSLPEYGKEAFTDGLKQLDIDDDAAYRIWGKDWRMPTIEECNELREHAVWQWCVVRKGWIVSGKGDYSKNSIFLPSTGYYTGSEQIDNGIFGNYWASSLDNDDPTLALGFYFKAEGVFFNRMARSCGITIRPVKSK